MNLYILHFRPIEHYPPIQNLLSFLQDAEEVKSVYCLSTSGKLGKLGFNAKIKILRFGKTFGSKFYLLISYLLYNFNSILFLIWKRPDKVVYFESISVFPLYIYKRIFNKKVEYYIHYHEYATIEDYKRMGNVERYLHSIEMKLYSEAKWISHTNKTRLQKFLKDCGIRYKLNLHKVMPNYPSKKWAIQNSKWNKGETLKLVYVGYSLTKEGSYIQELVDFLDEQNLEIELNLYCIKSNQQIKDLAVNSNHITINLKSAIAYSELPQVLSKCHVGLILYKAKTQNYIHNAPNKLFEYLSCGLDVWYPQEMEGIHEYDADCQPKVVRLDFNKMGNYQIENLILSNGERGFGPYFSEEVYQEILLALK